MLGLAVFPTKRMWKTIFGKSKKTSFNFLVTFYFYKKSLTKYGKMLNILNLSHGHKNAYYSL
jgi:hypothetical protein